MASNTIPLSSKTLRKNEGRKIDLEVVEQLAKNLYLIMRKIYVLNNVTLLSLHQTNRVVKGYLDKKNRQLPSKQSGSNIYDVTN